MYAIYFIDAHVDNLEEVESSDYSQIPNNFIFNSRDRSIKFTPEVPSKENAFILYRWILSYESPKRFVLEATDTAGKFA